MTVVIEGFTNDQKDILQSFSLKTLDSVYGKD